MGLAILTVLSHGGVRRRHGQPFALTPRLGLTLDGRDTRRLGGRALAGGAARSRDPTSRSSYPYRELELAGSWHLEDYTDSTVCLKRNDGAQESVWLVPAGSGQPKRVLREALAAHDGF